MATRTSGLVERERRRARRLVDGEHEQAVAQVLARTRLVAARRELHDVAGGERAALEVELGGAARREPAVRAGDDDLEVEHGVARPREAAPGDEHRSAVRLVVLGPEAPHLERELVQSERLDEEVDRDAAEALEQSQRVA